MSRMGAAQRSTGNGNGGDGGGVVDRAIAGGGGLQPFAAALGVSYQAIQKWRKSKRVPAERVLSVEAASGVPRHKLRPDIYPPPTDRSGLLTTRRRARA